MENGKLTYRILGGIITVVFVYNLFRGVMFILFGAMYIPPRTDVWLVWGGLLLSAIGVFYLKKSSIDFIKKSIISSIIIFVLLLPTVFQFFKPQILDYILNWESSHCISTGGSAPGGTPEFKCDNGDYIYYGGDGKDGKRLFKGGKSQAHFPYWLIY